MEGPKSVLESKFIRDLVMKHVDVEAQKLNYLLQINDQYFESQLKEVVCITLSFGFKLSYNRIYTIIILIVY